MPVLPQFLPTFTQHPAPLPRPRCGTATSPFGPLFFAGNADGLCHLHFALDAPMRERAVAELQARWPDTPFAEDAAFAAAWRQKLFPDLRPATPIPVHLFTRDTPLRRVIWLTLAKSPPTKCWTYAELAAAVRSPSLARQVGTAMAANPFAIIVPCHRVAHTNPTAPPAFKWGSSLKNTLRQRA